MQCFNSMEIEFTSFIISFAPVIKMNSGVDVLICSAQAFAVIAASPLHIDLSCVLENVIAELTAFLRKVC